MNAFKEAVPDQVTADWAKACPPVFTGTDPRKNEPYFDFGFMAKGGQGALKAMMALMASALPGRRLHAFTGS